MTRLGWRALGIVLLAQSTLGFLAWQTWLGHVTTGLAVTVIVVASVFLAFYGGVERGWEQRGEHERLTAPRPHRSDTTGCVRPITRIHPSWPDSDPRTTR